MSDHFVWRGGSELLLRHGKGAPVTLLILPALFEEANRMRRFTVQLMRGLAEQNIGSILPDLPGMGESLHELAEVSFDDWTDAARALANQIRSAEGRCLTIAIRGGALLDGVADHGWRLAPETGARLLRDMVRATALTGGQSASDLDAQARTKPVMLAGNLLSLALYASLSAAELPDGDRRCARMAGDVGAIDVALAGSRLWRAAEPGDDPELLASALDDIIPWMRQCAG